LNHKKTAGPIIKMALSARRSDSVLLNLIPLALRHKVAHETDGPAEADAQARLNDSITQVRLFEEKTVVFVEEPAPP